MLFLVGVLLASGALATSKHVTDLAREHMHPEYGFVVVLASDVGYAHMTANAVEHIVAQGVDSYIVSAADKCAASRLRSLGVRNVATWSDAEGEAVVPQHQSQKHAKHLRGKLGLGLALLEAGVSYLFMDSDVIWIRNPLEVLVPHFPPGVDLVGSMEGCRYPAASGNVTTKASTFASARDPSTDGLTQKDIINTGFYFAKPTENTLAVFREAHRLSVDQPTVGRAHPRWGDQGALNAVMGTKKFYPNVHLTRYHSSDAEHMVFAGINPKLVPSGACGLNHAGFAQRLIDGTLDPMPVAAHANFNTKYAAKEAVLVRAKLMNPEHITKGGEVKCGE